MDNEIENVTNQFRLMQNYPNPFNPETIIEFTLPFTQFTTLKVYNLIGEEILTLVSNNLTRGKYQIHFDGRALSSGVYIYQIVTENFIDTNKMILIK
jgi:hypothetical protein